MGIFKEDLINFGNLIDTEVEVGLIEEDFMKVFGGLKFEFGDSLIKIKGKKKGFFLKRGFEFRGAQEEGRVYNEKDYETTGMGIYLRIISPEGLDVLEKVGMVKEGEYLKMDVFEALKGSDIYREIPDAFRNRLLLKRYRVGKGRLSLFITVTK